MTRALVAWAVVTAACSPLAAWGQTRQVVTARTIGIANGQVALAFDRRTGALVSLRNLAARDEYLKGPTSEGNPFRVCVDTTDLPAPATDPNWWAGKIDGAMGGRVLDAAGCRLVAHVFRREGAAGVLQLTLQHPRKRLAFGLQVRLPDSDCAADCTLTVRNTDAVPHTAMTAFPHLTGLGLGRDRATNLGLMLASYGSPGVPAWQDGGGFYGREVSMQWLAVYEPSRDEGFGFITMDPALRPKLLRRFAPSGMSALYAVPVRLAPGASHTYPTARILVHRGSWRVVAQRYGAWFRQHFRPRRSPRWLRDVSMFGCSWMPSAQSVAEARKQAGGFVSYRQAPLLYLGDQYDMKEFAQYNEGVFTNPATYGAYMADGTYHPRSDLGGAAALREGIARLHRIGRRLTLYVAANSVLRDSEVLRRTPVEDWLLMDKPGHMFDVGYPNGISVCPGYAPWQDHLARVCRRLLAETGADGIRLDEMASLVPCHNPAHHHASPLDSNQWIRTLFRKVRRAMDEVKPDAILCTEGPIDYLLESCDGALQMFQPGRDIDAMRVALPEYGGFAYQPGAVEAALNGWVPNRMAARRGEWPWSHRGLAGRPADYGPGPGPDLRWHELRASFPEAIVDGTVSLRDPVAVGEKRWVGRLWRGKRYWLLVGGALDGSPLPGPLRISVPGLPPSVRYACELDAATLDVRNARLRRSRGSVYLTVSGRFGVVLLPAPGCPPLLLPDRETPAVQAGGRGELTVAAFAPWATTTATDRLAAALPGLEVYSSRDGTRHRLALRAPTGAEPGWYPLRVTGDCLPLKRWVRVLPKSAR